MANNTIDARLLAKMFLAGAKNLEAKKAWINELNVFPVPDGDTGTNMTMTIMSAAKEVTQADPSDMKAICKCISSGSLRGARGNSGVILSQLLRGFTHVVREEETIDAPIIARAFEKAVETAYKAVMKPKEGTILTVAKGASDKAQELILEGKTDLEPFFAEIIAYAEEVLAKTPEMLPVLKQAGVVDSGGQGLVQVLKGAYDGFLGKELDLTIDENAGTPGATSIGGPSLEAVSSAEIKFGYCTEFIVLLKKALTKKQETDFRSFLESIGDSIVMVADEDLCKVHVHTNDPGLAFQKALLYGELSNMKIDNMRLEHREKLFHMEQGGGATEIQQEVSGQAEKPAEAPAPETVHKEIGFVAVCVGEGIANIFRNLGVDQVIEGGQTMNPSTADIMDAVDKVDADTVFILPNNKNIILAANQAVAMDEKKKLIVIPSKTIAQGISAVVNYMEGVGVEENKEAMTAALDEVHSGEVTYAVRDTTIDNIEIRKGDFMGIGDSGIAAVGTSCEEVTMDLIDKMAIDETELISIYYGQDVTKDEAEHLRNLVSSKYANHDVELQFGGQPVYYYLVSTE